MPRVCAVAVALFCCLSPAGATYRRRAPAKHSARRAVEFNADHTNDPAPKPRLTPHSAGSAVLRAQILLDRAHFSVGEIDGSFGENMLRSVKAYQAAHDLRADGVVTEPVWAALNRDTAPAIGSYTIAGTDEAGPFEKIPEDMLEKAKLTALGYQSPLEELGERFHASPALLQKLNPGKDFSKAGEQILVPQVERARLNETAAKVIVTDATKSVDAVSAAGKVLAHYPATMGSKHDPLPVGDWKILRATHDPVFYYNSDLFWNADEAHAKAKIAPGPNNPVGVEWIGLSKEHYGIHGTPEPAEIGKTQSHGCIRLTNWDARELAGLVKPGLRAELRKE